MTDQMNTPEDGALWGTSLENGLYALFSGIQKVKVHKNGDFVDYETHHPYSIDERVEKAMQLIQADRQALRVRVEGSLPEKKMNPTPLNHNDEELRRKV